ncbi:MAG: hypothetical protein WDN75_13865 [Bacteroidota bacterium]
MPRKKHILSIDGVPTEPLFYYFDNWTANQTNQIHKGDCNECKFGLLKKGKQVHGEKGVWVGPFDTIDLARDYVKKLLKPKPEIHVCCY